MSTVKPKSQGPRPGRDWWQQEGPSDGVCRNCGAPLELDQEYCGSCGQKAVREPLTIRGLMRELPSRFVSLDRGFLRTFVDLTIRPGDVAYDYVRGVRKKYANPLAYFFLAATIQLLSLTLLRPQMIEFITAKLAASWEQSPGLIEKLKQGLGDDALDIIANMFVDLTRNAYSYLWILFCVFFALAFRLLPFAGKRRFNLSEIIVFSIYAIGHTVFLLGLIALIYVPLFDFVSWTIIVWPVYIVLLSRAAIQFFKGTWTAVFATLIALAVAFIGYLILFYLVFIVQLILRVRSGG